MKIVKIGGSAISDKGKPFSIKFNVLSTIMNDIAEYVKSVSTNLVIIHGGGSFGHPIVYECIKSMGIDSRCFSITSEAMIALNLIIISELLSRGVNAVSIPPHTICKAINDEFKCDMSIVKDYLSRGIIPVLYGDVVLSESNLGFKVISGDVISWILTKELNASTLIFVTDVEGLYTKDPKKYPDASLINRLSKNELTNIALSTSDNVDVTGGMLSKLLLGIKLNVSDVMVIIINADRKGKLFNALTGHEIRGTIVWY